MAISRPRDYVDQALSYLATGLQSILSKPGSSKTGFAEPGDLQAQLKSILANWDTRLREQVPRGTKTRVHELLDLRNKWAHPSPQEV
jgi:HEPN superfamily Swt1-like protein